ncbi:MAG TPA: DNA-directed RNA polymerase subunit beta [Actinomycetota bacterium]|nr:DNA-directed RNA polymerase subunit beta [Actinomycetota bacterium]
MADASASTRIDERLSFGKIKDIIELPDLIGIQRDSFAAFKAEGLGEAFRDVSPIEDFTGNLALEFAEHWFEEPKHTMDECREHSMTYSAPLFVKARFVNKSTGEIKEQTVFMGDFPMMTEKGTFIINGTERVVVSQLVRSPGVYFDRALDKTSDRELVSCRVIPSRGAWLEFEMDRKDTIGVRIDRKRRQHATVLLRALYGFTFDYKTGKVELKDREELEREITNEQLIEEFGDSEALRETLNKDPIRTPGEALMDIYRKLRPGEPPTAESAGSLLQGMYFNPKRYDLAKVGRYKINAKMDTTLPDAVTVITQQDIKVAVQYLVGLHEGNPDYDTDDIDHFGNRRVRSVGELIANQVRIGLARMERVIKERMSTQDAEAITPQSLVNIRPLTASIKEFFGTSQLSQFMDQTNPLSGLEHLRRLSALGPGGLSRERAGFEVRDVHPSHYGRMCPIKTPEGPNIGLIGYLSSFARVNPYGFLETPYRKVEKGRVTEQIDFLTADREDRFIIAQANAVLDERGRFEGDHVLCRSKGGEIVFVEPEKIDYMDVSPKQIVSVSTALIPFLEHDDANRALMGSNMQGQAVPLVRTDAPLIGTGIETRAAKDGGDVVVCEKAGTVLEVSADYIVVSHRDGSEQTYRLTKFDRSNQTTCINQRPIVNEGDRVSAGQVIADGPCTDRGELALGRNLLVAFMAWEGHNYEDAIILSERLVRDDVLTSIHIEEHDVEARDTKLGPEEITRDIPNVSEELLKDLDDRGIIRVGAEVNPGDILVGKVTPKGESELTPEERLLRAIFGEKARDVRDTSLKVPHGESGTVISVHVFTRDGSDELPPGVNQLVRVYVAQKRKVLEGDKLAGRHGNKGVIAKILPVEDMPFLEDGTPVDVILNPLGVPSRMNVGQVLETHLGWVASTGWRFDSPPAWMKEAGWGAEHRDVTGPVRIATPVFDGAREDEIKDLLTNAKDPRRGTVSSNGRKLVDEHGRAVLYNGRTGERFDQEVTVGYIYILKLLHLVDDKIHSRSTGPYSMITQQPLGGKAQFGGQRFGEMEVWALEAYGAAFALQELLTVKSDDVLGRVKVYEAIVKGENIPEPGIPESFKVLIKEMQSLCLNVEVLSAEGKQIEVKESDEDYRVQEELGIDLSRPERASGEEL